MTHPVDIRWEESNRRMKCKGQDLREFKEFWERVHAKQPKAYLEIGSNEGRSLWLIQDALAPRAVIVSLDVHAVSATHKIPLEDTFAPLRESGFIVMSVIADSTNPTTVGRVQRALGFGGTVDLLFIDADHSYAAVKADYELYRPLVSRGGMIAFHDIAHRFWGASRLWNEIKEDVPAQCSEHVYTTGMGIGVIQC